MKEKVQSFGRFLSGMVMPNIGAFIAWGLITALFIEAGWLPNAALATMVSPMLSYLLPVLIAYTGGKMVGGQRGAVMGAIATIGVVCGAPDYPMLMGAMIMGPLGGWVIKKFDKAVEGKIPAGFEMLVNNFSIGILGMLLAIVGFYLIGPVMAGVLVFLQGGVDILVNMGLLPLVSIFVEPAKVLFLNNAINHGIFTPLGAEQVKTLGKSVFYMIETNPGAGAGVLLAYWMFSKDKATKDSAPGALIVHVLGGIHEIYFPYVLMNPLLLLATIGGSVAAMFFNTIFNVGLVSPASPGSILALLAVAPKGGQLMVIISFLIGTGVSFLIASPIVRMSNSNASLEDAQSQMSDMKAASKGGAYAATADGGEVDLRTLDRIVFACDAGMGSSAMGAAVLQKKHEAKGLGNIKVSHYSVSEVPEGVKFVVCHQDLVERARKSAPSARIVTISNFMNAPQYDQIVQEILDAKSNKNAANAGGHDFHGGVLLKKNIVLNNKPCAKNDAIRAIGKLLVDSGYVTEKYVDGMIAKEDVFNTAIGNNLAIPHGVESVIGEIKNSGLAIMTYPDGIDWGDGETVKLVIAVASAGDDHVETLGKIATTCESEEAVDRIIHLSVDEIYDLFK
ncbi:MAG: PTS mannitol transporter subunit IICBA [Lachnospiraceae bacterium]|nr:PTS mannitol transporter subunit IICBA [Lachnospiraceae bacterium]